MFPIRDTIPHQRFPVVTVLLIAANLAAFVYETSLAPEALEELIRLNGVVPRRFVDPDWARAVNFPGFDAWPFLTSMFLHGGWLHLILNTWTLWIFGDNVEDRLGPVRYLGFYLAAGLFAGLLHLWTNPLSVVPTIGASGAVAGVMGAYFVLFPRAQIVTLIPILFYPLFIQVPAVLYLGFWFVSQVLGGATTVGGTQTGGVAWWAHVGGFLGGILFLFLFRKRGARAAAGGPAGGSIGGSGPVGVVLLLGLLLTGCDRDAASWRRDMGSEDRHEAFLAAVAVAIEKPRLAGPGLHSIMLYVDDELAWNRAGARRALASLEEKRPEVLLEYLILRGMARPAIREALLPVFERADGATRRATLDLVREHGWEAPPTLRLALIEAVRSDSAWAADLEAELALEPPDSSELRIFLGHTRGPR